MSNIEVPNNSINITDELFLKFDVIQEITLKKRLVKELSSMIEEKICNINDIVLEDNINSMYKKQIYREKYRLAIYDNNRKKLYNFNMSSSYPFHPPELSLNQKDYFQYLKNDNHHFQNALYTYKRKNCLCCSSILCGENWSAFMTLKTVIEEVNEFTDICRQIAYIVIVNVIKRKHLNSDINILEWLY
jgi:ubiquitin-protein ligase